MRQTVYASHFSPFLCLWWPSLCSAYGKAEAGKISVAELAHPACVSSGEGRETVMGNACVVEPATLLLPLEVDG